MKYNVSILLCFVAFVLSTQKIRAQSSSFFELTQKVMGCLMPSENLDFHLKYIQTTTMRGSVEEGESQSIEVEMKKKGLRQVMTSAQMDVFIDEKKAYVVYKEAKRIFSVENKDQAKAQINNSEMLKMLELLWETASIKEEKSVISTNRKLKIVPSEKMQKASHITHLNIVFDAKTLKLLNVMMYMEQKSYIEKIEIKYLIIDKKADLKPLSNAKSYIFDSRGNLLKKYGGYSIQDA